MGGAFSGRATARMVEAAAKVNKAIDSLAFISAGLSTLDPNQRITSKQLALIWQVKEGTLRNWRTQQPRRGPRYIKVGREVRYRVKDVLEWERKHAR
jgi:hypothetical protein